MSRKILKTLFASFVVASFLTVPAFAQSGAVTANYVNMRSGPGMNYEIVDCLVKGTVINIADTSNPSWYAISYNGQDGYMSSDYISIIDDLVIFAAPTPVPDTENDSVVSVPSGSTAPIAIPSPDVPSSPAPSATPEVTPSPSEEISVVISSGNGRIGGDYVRFRTGPDTTFTIIATYNRGQPLTILGTAFDWTKCSINGQEGFVFSKYVINDSSSVSSTDEKQPETASVSSEAAQTDIVIKTESKSGYISGNNVRFRSGPSLMASIIGEFYYANAVTITGTSGDWTAVNYNGKDGFVYSQYVKEGSYSVPSSDSGSAVSDSNGATGQDVVNYAMQYLGCSYKWGGTSPDTGFDCSGFVWYVYNHFGYILNRVAADQAQNGKAVSSDSLQPGDILCFYSNGSITHSGIYIGDGKFIHSATSNTGVIVTELSGNYWSRGFDARRIIN